MRISFLRLSPYLLFDTPHPQDTSPMLSIGYLASILERESHQVHLIDTEAFRYTREEIADSILGFGSRAVGIASMTPTAHVALEIAESLKRRDPRIFIFMFGQHSSVQPETFLYKDSPVDLCVQGEPEETVRELIGLLRDGMAADGISGTAVYDKRTASMRVNGSMRYIESLDELPFPKHDLFLNDAYMTYYPVPVFGKLRWGFVESSRGCPYTCVFCSPTLRVSYGNRYRGRSPRKVVDEMEHLVSKGVNAIDFIDDMFSRDRSRVNAICDEILKRGLRVKWVIQTRIDHIDGEMLANLKKAGCSTLRFGVESGSERILKILNKKETPERIKRNVAIAKKAGFYIACYFMLGCPTETAEEMEQTFQLCKELQPDIIQVAFFTPYPGSPAFESARASGTDLSRFSHYNEVVCNSSMVPDEELKRLLKRFYRRYLFSSGFIIRYVTRRLPYAFLNMRAEAGLILDSARFFFGKPAA